MAAAAPNNIRQITYTNGVSTAIGSLENEAAKATLAYRKTKLSTTWAALEHNCAAVAISYTLGGIKQDPIIKAAQSRGRVSTKHAERRAVNQALKAIEENKAKGTVVITRIAIFSERSPCRPKKEQQQESCSEYFNRELAANGSLGYVGSTFSFAVDTQGKNEDQIRNAILADINAAYKIHQQQDVAKNYADRAPMKGDSVIASAAATASVYSAAAAASPPSYSVSAAASAATAAAASAPTPISVKLDALSPQHHAQPGHPPPSAPAASAPLIVSVKLDALPSQHHSHPQHPPTLAAAAASTPMTVSVKLDAPASELHSQAGHHPPPPAPAASAASGAASTHNLPAYTISIQSTSANYTPAPSKSKPSSPAEDAGGVTRPASPGKNPTK